MTVSVESRLLHILEISAAGPIAGGVSTKLKHQAQAALDGLEWKVLADDKPVDQSVLYECFFRQRTGFNMEILAWNGKDFECSGSLVYDVQPTHWRKASDWPNLTN